MKHNWLLIAAIGAVLAVPFGLAVFEDNVKDKPADALDADDSDWSSEDDATDDDYDEDEDDATDDDEELGAVGEWERRLEPDIPFLLTQLDRSNAWLEPVIAAKFEAARGGDDSLAFEYVAGLADSYDEHQIELTHGSCPVWARFAVSSSGELGSALRRRWGEPNKSFTGEGASVFIWTDAALSRRVILIENGSDSVLHFSVPTSVDELLEATFLAKRASADKTMRALRQRFGDGCVAERDNGFVLRVNSPVGASQWPAEVEYETDEDGAVVSIGAFLLISRDGYSVEQRLKAVSGVTVDTSIDGVLVIERSY